MRVGKSEVWKVSRIRPQEEVFNARRGGGNEGKTWARYSAFIVLAQ